MLMFGLHYTKDEDNFETMWFNTKEDLFDELLALVENNGYEREGFKVFVDYTLEQFATIF